MKNNKKGFTLIELLVVIAIIGILATTLAPKLREQLAKAKDSKAVALLGSARTGAEVVLMDKMVQDTTGNDLTISLREIKSKLDKKSKDMISDSDGIIPIGGARKTSISNVTYAPKIILLATSATDIRDLFDSIDATITLTDDDIDLYLRPVDIMKSYSTEGKLWTTY